MFLEAMDEYLRTLSEYVYDHDKVVTYKWLSKELEIHVNVAKQILWEFWQNHKKDGKVECTFLLMGVLKDGSMRVEVVRDKDVAAAREKFKEIISEHLYSIQKSLPDIELLAISGEGDCRFSAIKCVESIERTESELSTLRWGTPDKNSPSNNDNNEDKKDKKVENKTEVAEKIENSIPETYSKIPGKKAKTNQKSSSTQKSGFNSLFGKAIEKHGATVQNAGKSESPSSKNEESPKKNSSPDKIRKSTLSNFIEKENQHMGEGSSSVRDEVREEVSINSKNLKSKSPSQEKKKKKISRGQKRQRSKDKEMITKKRRRIIVNSESSDGSSDRSGEEEEIPPSPENTAKMIEKSPSPPKMKVEGGKRKVLKVVDQLTEEDGFIVTRKVHVYESCSEDEMEVEVNNKPEKQQPKPEPKGKKNTKQTTLMNFFKKS